MLGWLEIARSVNTVLDQCFAQKHMEILAWTRYEGKFMMVFNYSKVLWEATEETRVK